jgi:Ca-activated chloride channel family protein
MGLRIIKMGLLTFFALNAYAINWWKTADQKAYVAYQHQQYQKAITLFKRADWRGVAAFRQKNYAEAIRSFAEITSAEGFYNLGTALAFQGDYDNAIKVYYKTLSIEPGHADAKYNLAILEKMKQDQKQPQNPEQQNAKNKKQDQGRPQDEPKDQENKQKSASKKQQTQEQQKKVQSKANKQQQAQEGQWLKLIEDDPAGLLKQKFLRDYQREVEEGKA